MLEILIKEDSDDLLYDFIEFTLAIDTEGNTLKIHSLPQVVQLASMELDRDGGHPVAF